MGCMGCLLFPFRLVWGLVGAVFGVVGHVFGCVLGVAALIVGLFLVISLVSALAWIPLLILGILFVVKAAAR